MSSSATPAIRLLRVYEVPDGGRRVLVDRLWPRGIAKEKLQLDEWAKDVAPSETLRREYHHGELDFAAFRERYLDELRDDDDASDGGRTAVRAVLDRWQNSGEDELVLLYAAKDTEQNHALVLAEHLRRVQSQRS